MNTTIRRIIFFVVFCFIACSSNASADSDQSSSSRPKPLQVLFIGNSYTYFNDMPVMLAEMSHSQQGARGLRVKMIAVPAATLQQLWDNGDAKKAIEEGNWDVVVLQEQSILPTVEPEKMKLYARKFDAIIKEHGAKTALYVTWARKAKPEMQVDLNAAYYSLAKELGSIVVPVGNTWQIALAKDSSIELYMDDGSHPTSTGSYLAACTFYQVLIKSASTCPSPSERFGVNAKNIATAKTSVKQAIAQLH